MRRVGLRCSPARRGGIVPTIELTNPRVIHRGRRFLVRRGRWGREGTAVVTKTARSRRAAVALRHEHAVLRHVAAPGIAEALLLDEGDDLVTLVLTDAGPEDLEERLRRGPLTMDAFLDVAVRLAEIVGHLHARSILHRDVSPANVVLAPGDEPTLVDFDLATSVVAVSRPRAPDRIEGTLAYVSPEQTGRVNRVVDARSDLYSLGATYYAMLTGAPPFADTSPTALVHAHVSRRVVPPADLSPNVPHVVSDIVVRLLAKAPEERYQSAAALAADLRTARGRWHAQGRVDPFELDVLDRARELPVPGRLYGRDPQLSALVRALRAAEGGALRFVTVTGETGCGKTALLEAFEQRARSVARVVSARLGAPEGSPYDALIGALRPELAALAREPADVVSSWRRRIAEHLGSSAPALVGPLPELASLLGEQPPLAHARPDEDELRVRLAFAALVRALGRPEQPLVLLFDDAHLIDAASLSVLTTVLRDAEASHVVIAVTAQPDALTEDHPLREALDALRGPDTELVGLSPLTLEDVVALCCDAFGSDPDRVGGLAELVVAHSAGLPLYVHRVLRSFHEAGLIGYDERRGLWDWDTQAIARLPLPEHAVEVLLTALRRLPPEGRAVLGAAACAGRTFDLGVVADAREEPVEDAARALWEVLQAGFVRPGPPQLAEGTTPVYGFAHERVHEAAYHLLPRSTREELHLRIARALLARKSPDEVEEHPFEILLHLERALRRIREPSERARFAELQRAAGRRSSARSAYEVARSHFMRGLEALPEGAWSERRELALDLLRGAAECAYATGDRALLEELLLKAGACGLSAPDRAQLLAWSVAASTRAGLFDEAVRRGREGLSLLGIELPARMGEAEVRAELARADAELRRRSIDAMLDAPPMPEPSDRIAAQLLQEVGTAIYFSDPLMSTLIDVWTVWLMLERGSSPEAASALIGVARQLGVLTGDWVRAHEIGRLGVDLARRTGDPARESETLTLFAVFVNHWRAPLRSDVPILRRAFDAGMVAGGLTYAAYARSMEVAVRFFSGDPLATVELEADAAVRLARRVENPVAENGAMTLRQAVRSLRGLTESPHSYDEGDVHESFLAAAARGTPVTACLYHLTRMHTSLVVGDLHHALAHQEALAPCVGFVRGMILEPFAHFYGAIATAAAVEAGDEAAARAAVEVLGPERAALERWAEVSPESFRPMARLVAAEAARLTGDPRGASDLYDEAIEAAAEQGMSPVEALASERAAAHLEAGGRRRPASLYRAAARDAYGRWGATAKARTIEATSPAAPAIADDRLTVEPSAIRRAAELFGGVLFWDQLVDRILRAALELTGATRGVLVLEEDHRLLVRAALSSSEVRASPLRARLGRFAAVPPALIERAWRTDESVVVADTRVGTFATDPYVATHHVRSVAAVPIRRHALRMGVLYLESRVSRQVFDRGRVAALEVLSPQIAVALENGVLFEKLRFEVEERRQIEARVRLVADAGMALGESLDVEPALERVTHLVVRHMADWCAVDVIENEHVHRVAQAASGPGAGDERRAPARALRAVPPAHPLVTGRAVLVRDVSDPAAPDLRSLLGEADVARLRALGVRALLCAPAGARGRVAGAITLASRTARWGSPEVSMAEELGARVAMALENVRLYRTTQEAVRLRDDFLSIASHELRGPLSTLQLAMQGIDSGVVAAVPPPLGKALGLAARQVDRLSRLVDELLDVSRLRAGKLYVALEEVDLGAVVADVLERLGPALRHAGCPVEVDLPRGVIGVWSSTRLAQIVENLLSNAMKFGRGAKIEVRGEVSDGVARLIVRDHGIGIPADRLPFVFDRFERAVSPEHFGGLGLGLYIVRQIAQALGGGVRVESVEGEGSTFTLELPLAGPAASAHEPRSSAA